MFKPAILGLSLALAITAASMVSADTPSETQELMELSGIDVVFDAIAAPLKQQSERDLPFDAEMKAAWNQAVDANFVAPEMFREATALVEGQLTEADLTALFAFYQSDLGRKITAVEVAAQKEDEAGTMQKGFEILQGFASPDHPRVVAYKALAEATQAVDTATALAMTVGYATVSGMFSAQQDGIAPSNADLWSIVTGQREQIRSAMEPQIFISFAYTYRDLSEEEVAAYVAFLETPPAQKFYKEVMLAVSGVLSRRAEQFGHDLMVASGKREA